MFRELAAAHVMTVCRATPNGRVSARELNALVATYPPPEVTIERLGLDAGDIPILYVEMDFDGVIDLLNAWMESVGAPFPVFYIPMDVIDKWNHAPGVMGFIQWLNGYGMDLQLNVGGSPTWLKGHWVVLVDIRLRFLQGAELPELLEGVKEVQRLTQGGG